MVISMRNRILRVLLTTFCITLALSGCSPKPTSIVDFKNEKSYFAFPKTDWGMTPLEVMKAFDLNMEDATILPEVREPSTSLTISLNIDNGIKIIGEPASNVTFGFTYLMVAGKGAGELGLTHVTADFDYSCLDKVMNASKNDFGDTFAASIVNPSKDNFGTLTTEKRQTITDVFSQYEGYSDFNKDSGKLSLSTFEVKQIPDAPSPVRVTYNGYFAAMANNDYSTFNKAMDDFRKEFEITD